MERASRQTPPSCESPASFANWSCSKYLRKLFTSGVQLICTPHAGAVGTRHFEGNVRSPIGTWGILPSRLTFDCTRIPHRRAVPTPFIDNALWGRHANPKKLNAATPRHRHVKGRQAPRRGSQLLRYRGFSWTQRRRTSSVLIGAYLIFRHLAAGRRKNDYWPIGLVGFCSVTNSDGAAAPPRLVRGAAGGAAGGESR